jgi:hypothetical protein
MRTRILAAAALGALAIGGGAALAAPAAMAATPVSGTATVNTALTLSLDHSSFTLGTGNAGDSVNDGISAYGSGTSLAAAAITATVVSNSGTGYNLTLATTKDFATGTFPASDVSIFDPYASPGDGNNLNTMLVPAAANGSQITLAKTAGVTPPTGTPTQLGFWLLNMTSYNSGGPNAALYHAGLPNVPGGTYTANFSMVASAN